MKKLFICVLVGLLIAVTSSFVAFFFLQPKLGFEIDKESTPMEVQEMLKKQPAGVPLSKEQLKEINRYLNINKRSSDLLIKNVVLNAWYVYLLLSALGVCLLNWLVFKKNTIKSWILFVPSFAVLTFFYFR